MVAKRRSRSSRMTALLSFTSNAANKIRDRKSTRLNSSQIIPYTTLFRSIFCRQFPTTTKQKENAGRDTCAPHAGCVRSSERKSMSRELIVSVNGREKKIAIVENDRVTEFYIERGEQNQRSEEHTSELQSNHSLHDALPIYILPAISNHNQTEGKRRQRYLRTARRMRALLRKKINVKRANC